MKAPLLFAVPAAIAVLAGCSMAARSADMYRDDTQAVLATKNDAIRTCYDGVLKTTPGAQGSVAITFDVQTQDGKIVNVAVDQSGTTAPAPVAACVTQSLSGLALTPPDQRKGQGRWTYQFTAPATPASPAAVTAPTKS